MSRSTSIATLRSILGAMLDGMKGRCCIVPVAAVALLGCGDVLPVTCTDDIRPAVSVAVIDSVTRVPIADGADGVIRDGEYVDTLVPGFATTVLLELEAGYERPGIYSVEVAHEGYSDWQASEVMAPAGDCHVQTARLTARLRPIP